MLKQALIVAAPRSCRLAVLWVAITTPIAVAAELRSDEDAEQWIRGTGETMEMRIQGEILLSSGEPAKQPTLSASVSTNNAWEPIPVTLDGNRFEIWVPVHRLNWRVMRINAMSEDKRQRSSVGIVRESLRQTAIDGLTFQLQHSTRTVSLNVIHQGSPVADANVKVEMKGGFVLLDKTVADGILKIDLLPKEQIRAFTVWTDDHRFGGFTFDREPIRDPNAQSQTVQLASCRDQTIRIVDGEGRPLSDVAMDLQVATPPPNYNYLGSIDASHMVTDENGEAVFQWFPDWEDIHCYVDLDDDRWVQDGKATWVNGDYVVKVKAKKPRHRVVGVLNRAVGSKAGFHVLWRSFQGEKERTSDHLTSVTDREGRFSANVMAGATYCVFINDADYVSEMFDLIPFPSDDSEKPIATLNVRQSSARRSAVDRRRKQSSDLQSDPLSATNTFLSMAGRWQTEIRKLRAVISGRRPTTMARRLSTQNQTRIWRSVSTTRTGEQAKRSLSSRASRTKLNSTASLINREWFLVS